MKAKPIWKPISYFFIALLVVASLASFKEHSRLASEHEDASSHYTLSTKLRLEPGASQKIIYDQSYTSSHGSEIYIKSNFLEPDTLQALQHTEFEISSETIGDSFSILDLSLNRELISSEHHIPIASAFGIAKGKHQITISVSRTPYQGNQDLEIYGKYLFCGLEALPAAIMKVAGYITLTASALLVLIIFLFSRKRKRSNQSIEEQPIQPPRD